MADPYFAYAWSDGSIAFGHDVPEGALAFLMLDGERRGQLEELVEVHARHGYDDGVLLVPGVPEASDQVAAVEALVIWRERRFGSLSDLRDEGAVVVGDEVFMEVH